MVNYRQHCHSAGEGKHLEELAKMVDIFNASN